MIMIKNSDDITLRNLSDVIVGILNRSKITKYFINLNLKYKVSNKTDRIVV